MNASPRGDPLTPGGLLRRALILAGFQNVRSKRMVQRLAILLLRMCANIFKLVRIYVELACLG